LATGYFFNLNYHGHINPCVPVVRELVNRGEHIVFYAAQNFRPLVESAGAEFRSFPFEEDEKGISIFHFVTWQQRVAELSMVGLIADAARDNPSYVLLDYTCLWGRVLAQHRQLPQVVVHTTVPFTTSGLPPYLATARAVLRSPRLLPRFRSFRRLDRKLARRWRVPRLGTPMNLVVPEENSLHVVLTGRALQPPGNPMPANFHYTGPCVRPAGTTRGEPLPVFDSRPVVYIALGTFWNNRPEFYRLCLEAFRDPSVQVLMSVGTSTDIAALGPLPEHIHVRSVVDQIEALRRADVFLSHCGMNSLTESLLTGVPLLLLPQALDQFSLAEHVASLGAGLVLQAGNLTAQSLRAAAEKALNDASMRMRARQIGDSLRASGGPERAAETILQYTRSPRSVSNLKAPAASTASPRVTAG
jgi:MGT family glycosyltransferase